MVRGPRHASWQSIRNCMGGARWLVDWYGCGGVGATPTVLVTPTVREGGEERGIANGAGGGR